MQKHKFIGGFGFTDADMCIGDVKAGMSFCQSGYGGFCRLIRLDRIPAYITRDWLTLPKLFFADIRKSNKNCTNKN